VNEGLSNPAEITKDLNVHGGFICASMSLPGEFWWTDKICRSCSPWPLLITGSGSKSDSPFEKGTGSRTLTPVQDVPQLIQVPVRSAAEVYRVTFGRDNGCGIISCFFTSKLWIIHKNFCLSDAILETVNIISISYNKRRRIIHGRPRGG